MLLRLTAGLYLSRFREFWRLRARVANIRVRAFSRLYGLRKWAGAEAESATSLLHIAKATIFNVAVASIFAGLLWYTNPLVAGWPISVTGNSYTDLLAVIAGVGGVFIGLYYAALTAAMSSVYVATPHNLRELVVREQYGSAYMRFLGVVTFLSLMLLGMDAYGFSTSASGPPVMVAFSGIAVIGFVTLRTWAFNLFDPTSVETTIIRELRLLLRQVTVGGYQSRNPAFQQFAQRTAARALGTLKTLADVCEGQRHLNEGPLLRVSHACLRLGAASFVACEHIPSKSRWFPDRYVHPNWYRTDDSHVEIASLTGTVLQPTVARDGWWLEDGCEKVTFATLRSFLGRHREDLATSLLSAFHGYTSVLAERGAVERALNVADEAQGIVITHVAGQPPSSDGALNRLALVDSICTLRIGCLLAAATWADELGRERAEQQLQRVNWARTRVPYRIGLHKHSISRAEWLADRLAFERTVTGQPKSPIWYMAELLCQPDAEVLAAAVSGLLHRNRLQFEDMYKRLLQAKHHWASSCALSGEFHYWTKAASHLGRFDEAWSKVSDKRNMTDLPWPTLSFDTERQGVSDATTNVIERMAALLAELPPKPPEDLPDYPGQFLHSCGEGAFDVIMDGDAGQLTKVFPAYVSGCLAKQYNLHPPQGEKLGPVLENRLLVSFAPVLDAVEISGYSYVLSEAFPDKPTWPVIQAVWDRYFGLLPTAKAETQIGLMISLTKNRFGIPHRALLRTRWQQQIKARLRRLPRKRIMRRFSDESVADHSSALVRVVAGGEMMGGFYDGVDVFVAMYLRKRPQFDASQMHHGAERLLESIEHAQASWPFDDDATEDDETI